MSADHQDPGEPGAPERPGPPRYHRVRRAPRPTGAAPAPPEPSVQQPEVEAPTEAYVRRPGDRVVRVPRRRALRRVLGVPELFSTGYGNVGSSIYYALGVTALYALGAAPLALLIAGIFFVLTVLSYAEATVSVPEAGGASSFARRGFNELVSFLAGWTTLLSYTVTIAISSYTAAGYLSVFFPGLAHYPNNAIFAVVVIAALMALNAIGIREAASLSIVFALIDLSIQVVLVTVGGIFLFNLPLLIHQVDFGVAPTWPSFVSGIAVAMVAYTGIETISNMAGEARSPSRTVPRSYAGLVFAVLILFVGISTVALSAMPVYRVDGTYTTDLVAVYINDPVAGVARHLPAPFSTVLTPVVGVLASSILLIGANAGVIGVSRLSFSMGMHHQLPRFWAQLHPRFYTPYASIIFFSAAAAGLAATGSITQMSEIYIYGATLNFTIAHASLIGMRVREPDLARPFRLPTSVRVRQREIPVTAVVGGLGTLAVFILMFINHPFARYAGTAWMIVGFLLYVYYRHRNGLPLLSEAPVPSRFSGRGRRVGP